MSGVVKFKQQTTTIKFIEVARQRAVFTLRMMQKLPKRTAFYPNAHPRRPSQQHRALQANSQLHLEYQSSVKRRKGIDIRMGEMV